MTGLQSANRLTCFALVSAIETDIRAFLASNEFLPREFLPKDARENAVARCTRDRESSSMKLLDDDRDLLYYVDFGDLAKALRTGRIGFVDTGGAQAVARRLDELVPVRNRVCHSRPLEPEDFSQLLELASGVASLWPEARWRETTATLERLKTEPSFVLRLQIPQYWREGSSRLAENLPLPEFDDTGFLGRSADRRDLNRIIVSAHPVVSVVGEGGVGKTALAVRCLYDIVDGPDCPFDAMAWVSLKTQVLTARGAVEVRDAVREVLGVVRAAGGQLGVPQTEAIGIDACFDEILSYMGHFGILLAIDNLETVGWRELRPFLAKIPSGSKVLITSRVGLGEFEQRYALEALEERTAVELARRFAKAINCSVVVRQPENELLRACRLLHCNPLLVKWYVSSINAGAHPNRLLDKKALPFQEALKFCFSNLFERLDPVERLIVHVLASARRPLSLVELSYATGDYGQDQVDWALNTLHHGSILRRRPGKAGEELQYTLTDIAAEYVLRFAPPPKETFDRVVNALKKLRAIAEESSKRKHVYKYDPYAIEARNRDEAMVASFLVRALRAATPQQADRELEQARKLLPTFPELYRVAGMVYADRDDHYRASQEFEQAVELAPRSAAIRYQYWRFLLNKLQDAEAALAQSDEALALDPGDATLRTAKAQTLVRLGRCKEATRLYDALLGELGGRDKKWRVITRDQAADCHRRLAEQQVHQSDPAAALASLSRALDILIEGAANSDMDEQTPSRAGKVVEDWVRLVVNRADGDGARRLGESMEKIATWMAPGSIPVASWDSLVTHFGAQVPAIRELTTIVATTIVPKSPRPVAIPGLASARALGDTLHGSIRSLVREKGFGFIRGDGGLDWFFHRNDLVGDQPWPSLEEGVRVTFIIGTNQKGRCATQVAIETPA